MNGFEIYNFYVIIPSFQGEAQLLSHTRDRSAPVLKKKIFQELYVVFAQQIDDKDIPSR